MKKKLILFILSLTLFSCQEKTSSESINKVTTESELKEAIAKAEAGSEIVMQNGVWKDIQIKFFGKGTEDRPITLRAETAGKVTIEGESNLSLGGEYLVVKDLHFKNGYTPTKNVIQFKFNSDTIANNSRITNCVIDEFTKPNREVSDHWVEFWGRNNMLDHCNIVGKSNFGPTVRVFLKGNEHVNNHHQIVNNHFGPRPRKGGPHGETLQIGSSHTSMAPSYTNVSNNYFDRCNGEVEIISNKSNFNEFRNNVFFESEGSLVLRHGNYCTIDGNVFIGNDNSEFIGGIRVINTGHWITNNYFYNIKGDKFRSALAVMNGIPKSPLNRYNQVTDVVVAYNTYIDCKSPFQFGVGTNIDKKDVLPASEIRSARPERMIVANNLVYNHNADNYPVVNYDDVGGISFKNNILNSENKSSVTNDGLITKSFEVAKIAENFYAPSSNLESVYEGFDFETITEDYFGSDRTKQNSVGAITLPTPANATLFDKSIYGSEWFSSEASNYKGETLEVTSGEDLVSKLKTAKSGDILSLKAEIYNISESLLIDKTISIVSADANKKAEIQFNTENPGFVMHPKGILKLDGVVLRGDKTQDAIVTLDKNMSKAFNLFINNTEIANFKTVIKAYKASFADTISISNSVIKNSLEGILLNTETDSKGDYNAEFVTITNTTFDNVAASVLNYYRGGYDESTIGGNLILKNNTFTNSGNADKSGLLIQNHGIVNVVFADNTFKNNAVKEVAVLWGEKGQKPENNTVINSGKIRIEQNLKQKLMY
ncbi:alginate lyase [Cellulophaga baltica]|uniref:chondroitinase-B domain-containing protein n=1 Tax=Cellulophaga TaxID=104264 RepID=UPI001C072E4A|nr:MULTISPECIES: chondroitinase-B domain-containing protein [Cellulophaga]MBU2997965.1 alginate lyase [Cellulophaga baltica]MDO6769366.1 chondroitinase-B domain-containing protein [Cellulophaga sp. 1_MG-2023]